MDAVRLAEVHGFGACIMTVAADGDPGCRPLRPDTAVKAADMGAHLDAGRRLARPQHHGHRTAGCGVVDVDRQEAVLVIMRVKQRQLLAAVNNVAGVVDVEGDACGRFRVAGHPLVNEGVGQPNGIAQGRRIFQTRQRRLGGQIGAAVGQTTAGQLEGGIAAQAVEVVAVLVAAADREQAGADHVGEPVGDARGIAAVGDQLGEAVGDAETALNSGQKHDATIRGNPPTVEGGSDLLCANGWKFEGWSGIDHGGRCGGVFEGTGSALATKSYSISNAYATSAYPTGLPNE